VKSKRDIQRWKDKMGIADKFADDSPLKSPSPGPFKDKPRELTDSGSRDPDAELIKENKNLRNQNMDYINQAEDLNARIRDLEYELDDAKESKSNAPTFFPNENLATTKISELESDLAKVQAENSELKRKVIVLESALKENIRRLEEKIEKSLVEPRPAIVNAKPNADPKPSNKVMSLASAFMGKQKVKIEGNSESQAKVNPFTMLSGQKK
jgi:dynactin complex subunit